VFASASAYYLALATSIQELRKIYVAAGSIHIAEFAHRLSSNAGALRVSTQKLNFSCLLRQSDNLEQTVQPFYDKKSLPACAFYDSHPQRGMGDNQPNGPHRLTVLPLDASAWEGVNAEDGKWLAEQEARFSSDSEGLATKANFGLVSFEAINFMDGHRSTAEIADLISAEYLIDIDQAWVDRLVSILERQKLVTK
jgi:hypothetical protein